jgi:hypothetical protein
MPKHTAFLELALLQSSGDWLSLYTDFLNFKITGDSWAATQDILNVRVIR